MPRAADMRNLTAVEAKSADELTTTYYAKSWGFVIGINDYGGEHPTLANARNDAAAFAELLRTNYKFDQVFTLYDQEATGSALLEWLRDKLPAQIDKNDRLIIFFAGHGATRESGRGEKRGYLIPHDAQAGKYADYLDMTELRDACGWIRAKHILLVLDCCFSGVAAITARSAPPEQQRTITDAYLAEITRRSAWQVLTAGASDELAADSGSRPGHSAFTSSLLAGLEGHADQNNDGIITASELAGFVKPEVSRQRSGMRAKGQTPFFNYLAGSDQGDFVFLRHDTAIKVQPTGAIEQGLAQVVRTSPLLVALVAALLLVVIFLTWSVLADRRERQAFWGAVTGTAVYQATSGYETLVAATNEPPATQTALAVQQTVTAKEEIARAAVTGTALAGDAPTATPTVLAPIATPTPQTATSTPRPAPSATTPAQRQDYAFFYRARPGDTWATIAAAYGLSESELQAYNQAWLECTTLNDVCRTQPQERDTILIPGLQGQTLMPRGSTHIFTKDDLLFRLAVRSGYSVAQLQQANPETASNPENISAGARIYIPLPSETQATSSKPAEPQALSCVGVADPPLQIGDKGKICLVSNSDVGLRDRAGGTVLQPRLPNGTQFTVTGGPTCAFHNILKREVMWWQVETTDRQGWLPDAGDPEDTVYLCRLDIPTAASAPAANFDGEWETNFARVTINQTDAVITGEYTRYGQTGVILFEGTVVGATLTGKTKVSGAKVSFTLAEDGKTFTGSWAGNEQGDWCGARLSQPLPAGCGFSGEWQSVMTFPDAAQPPALVLVTLQQIGDQVNGSYAWEESQGTLTGQIGVAGHGSDPQYSFYGDYTNPIRGNGTFRFDLADYASQAFQGCWLNQNDGATGAWCGSRAAPSADTCQPPPSPCP